MKTVIVNLNDANQRIDTFLKKYFKKMPLGQIYKYIRKKRVKINGRKVEINYRLKVNDEIQLYINDEFFNQNKKDYSILENIQPNLNILYEDNNILVVDKKPGITSHPDRKGLADTLILHIKAYLYKKGEYKPKIENTFAPALCNRLDRNTGGIIIAAKNAQALRTINEKIKNNEIKKYYLTITQGTFSKKQNEFTGYLIKNKKLNKVAIFDKPQKGSHYIITKYKVLKEKQKMSLVEIELVTGRPHQIRAHFAAVGHPLAGDYKYGNKNFNKLTGFKYQALYAYKVVFDFKDSGILNYLSGKVFKVKQVEFAKLF